MRHPGLRGLGAVGLLLLCAAMPSLAGAPRPAVAAAAAATPPMDEYVVKARALVELSPYFKWPEPKENPRPFVITVVGKSPFGSKLDTYAHGRTVQARRIEVRYVARAPEIPPCDLVFLCRSENRNAGEILDWVKGKAVVTVADDEDLQFRGVMVNLLIKSGLLKIYVNLPAIQSEKVGVSSQLLGYARLIEPGRPAQGQ